MSVKAIFLGSTGVLTETADLELTALSEAAEEFGLDWTKSNTNFRDLLDGPGGVERIRAYAAERGDTVDAHAIFDRKTDILVEKLKGKKLTVRKPIHDVIEAARSAEIPLGLVTTAPKVTVHAVLAALGSGFTPESFDLIVTLEDVDAVKPAPDCYAFALDKLGLDPDSAIAIEDSPCNARAARKAGLATLAVPGKHYADRDFPAEVVVTDRPTAAILDLSRAA